MLKHPQPHTTTLNILQRLDTPDNKAPTEIIFDLQEFLECPNDALTTAHLLAGTNLLKAQLAKNPRGLLTMLLTSTRSSSFLFSNLCEHMQKQNRLSDLHILFSDPYIDELIGAAVDNSCDLMELTENFPLYKAAIMRCVLKGDKLMKILQTEQSPESALKRLNIAYPLFAKDITTKYQNSLLRCDVMSDWQNKLRA